MRALYEPQPDLKQATDCAAAQWSHKPGAGWHSGIPAQRADKGKVNSSGPP